MSADLAAQKAIRTRLVNSPDVVAHVPDMAILDVNHRPAPRPSIIIGEADVLTDGQDIARRRERVTHTLHIWTMEASTEQAKTIMGAVKEALTAIRLSADGWSIMDSHVPLTRTLRDPDGETTHGVMSVTLIMARAP